MSDDFWTARCDICGKLLNRLANEDFYDEARGIVTCAEHWKGDKIIAHGTLNRSAQNDWLIIPPKNPAI